MFALVTTAYIALRFWRLTDSCLWFDEIFSVHAAEHSWNSLFSFVALDLIHPPLFYILLKLWIAVGGEGLFWLRLFPVMFAVVSLVPFVLFLREVKQNRWVEIVALFLLAVNGSLIKYSQEVRMYSLLLCLSLFSMWLFARYFNKGKSFVPLILVNLLLIYTHYFGWFVIVAEVVAILIFQRIKWQRMLLMFAVELGCFIPWICAVWNAAYSGSELGQNIGWMSRPGIREMVTFVFDLIEPFYYQASSAEPVSIFKVSLPILLIVGLAMSLYCANWKKQADDEQQAAKILILFITLPLVVAFVASWLLPYSIWGTRHLVIVFAPLAIITANAVVHVSVRSLRIGLMTLLILFTGYGYAIQASRPVEQPIWCSFESIGRQIELRCKALELRRQVPIYVVEDLAAYHLWFAFRKERGQKGWPEVVKVFGVPGTTEDKAFFLPRGFDDVPVMHVDQMDVEEFWLVYRAPTRDLDQPPLNYFFDRDFYINAEELHEEGGYKIIAMLLQKRHSLKLYGEASDDRFTRQSALAELKNCERHPTDLCLDVATFLMRLYAKGDDALLGPLFDAALKSDGHFAEDFGGFLSDVLQFQMTRFLSSVKNRPKSAQVDLCFLAIGADGSGNGEYWENDVRAKLEVIKNERGNPLKDVAHVCIAELERFQANQH